jgi:hypothetical protein
MAGWRSRPQAPFNADSIQTFGISSRTRHPYHDPGRFFRDCSLYRSETGKKAPDTDGGNGTSVL